MSIGQLFKNPNQLTRSENRQIEEAIAGLNAEFENLRQRLRGQVEQADVDGAEYTALLMATTMSQIAIMQGAQRGGPKVISSMRTMGLLQLRPGSSELVQIADQVQAAQQQTFARAVNCEAGRAVLPSFLVRGMRICRPAVRSRALPSLRRTRKGLVW